MSDADPNGYLMRFEDGPLSRRHNVENLGGATGNTVVKREVFGWPLPDRLGVLCHEGVDNVALWDADDPQEGGLPAQITGSPNAVVYVKISESQLPDDSLSRIMRGAEYRLEQ